MISIILILFLLGLLYTFYHFFPFETLDIKTSLLDQAVIMKYHSTDRIFRLDHLSFQFTRRGRYKVSFSNVDNEKYYLPEDFMVEVTNYNVPFTKTIKRFTLTPKMIVTVTRDNQKDQFVLDLPI